LQILKHFVLEDMFPHEELFDLLKTQKVEYTFPPGTKARQLWNNFCFTAMLHYYVIVQSALAHGHAWVFLSLQNASLNRSKPEKSECQMPTSAFTFQRP
jgi:hypothetical protein